jgi:hypothetical protein
MEHGMYGTTYVENFPKAEFGLSTCLPLITRIVC